MSDQAHCECRLEYGHFHVDRLCDQETDIREEIDASEDHPDVVAKIAKLIRDAHVPATLDRFKIRATGDRWA